MDTYGVPMHEIVASQWCKQYRELRDAASRLARDARIHCDDEALRKMQKSIARVERIIENN